MTSELAAPTKARRGLLQTRTGLGAGRRLQKPIRAWRVLQACLERLSLNNGSNGRVVG